MKQKRHVKQDSFRWKILLSFLVLLLPTIVWAHGHKLQANIDLGHVSDHFLDLSGMETIETLTQADGAARFRKSTGSVPNYGVRPTRTAVLWLRVQVPDLAMSGQENWVFSLNEPRTRKLTLYIPTKTGFRSIEWIAGQYDHDPVSVSRYPTLHAYGEEISNSIIHVKIETASSMRGFLWLSTDRHFDWSYSRSGYLLGIMSGALAAMVIVLLANGIFARDRASLALAVTMLCYLLYFISHHAVLDTYLLPGTIAISRPMSLSATFGIFSFGLLYAYFALEMGKNFPRLRWLFIILIILLFCFSLLTIADVLLNWFVVRAYSSQIGIVSRLLMLLAALLTLTRDWRRAVVFLVCWLPTIIGANLRLLHDAWPALGTSELMLNSAYILSMTSLTLFAIFSSVDIHIRERRLTAEVRAQAERIRGFAEQQKLAAIGQMAGKIAHEVNNLLHPIINLARRVASGTLLEADRAHSLATIGEAAKRAAEVVASLLASVRPETGGSRVLPFGRAINEAAETIAGMIPSTIRLTISVEDQAGPEVVYGEVFRVLINLIANAVHALDGSGDIHIVYSRQQESFVLTVIDNGSGMDSETHRRALEPFFTTRENTGGTGLGLSIVGDIVAAWNGTLAMDSAPGSGTTITIRLSANHDAGSGKGRQK